jgi:hypothetical protein
MVEIAFMNVRTTKFDSPFLRHGTFLERNQRGKLGESKRIEENSAEWKTIQTLRPSTLGENRNKF